MRRLIAPISLCSICILYLQTVVVSHADLSVQERITHLTNHLQQMENGGIRMLARFTEQPDARRSVDSNSKVTLIPNTNRLAEILRQGSVFRFDETVEGAKVVGTSAGETITLTGWMIGQYPAVDSDERVIGKTTYFWKPGRQFAFTIATNGLQSPGGWVEELNRRRYQLGKSILMFSLPEHHWFEITASNSIVGHSALGDNSVFTTSNSALYLDLEHSREVPLGYEVIRYTYKHPQDQLPIRVDRYSHLSQIDKTFHVFSTTILEIEYLRATAENLPEKVRNEIEIPHYADAFEVTSEGEIQIVGTNRVKVLDASPIVPTLRRKNGLVIICILTTSALAIFTLVFLNRPKT